MAAIDEFSRLRTDLVEAQRGYDELTSRRNALHTSMAEQLTIDKVGRFGFISDSEMHDFDDVCRRHAELGESVRRKFDELIKWLQSA